MLTTKITGRSFKLLSLIGSCVLLQLIPFACGQGILRTVTPYLLDESVNVLDYVIGAVAPLVLP